MTVGTGFSSRLSLAVLSLSIFAHPTAAQSSTEFRISSPLRLDTTSLVAGQTLTGAVTYTNRSGAAMTIQTIAIAARAPGATHSGGPFTDLTPNQSSVTLADGASVTLTASRTFTSAD